jgi:hypothetical protein
MPARVGRYIFATARLRHRREMRDSPIAIGYTRRRRRGNDDDYRRLQPAPEVYRRRWHMICSQKSAVVLVGILFAVSANAAGDSDKKSEAKLHFDLGNAYYAAKDYEHAAKEYLAAYDRLPLPDLLFNAAQAYRLLGRKDEAIKYYREYLRVAPTGRVASQAFENLSELGGAVEPQKTPTATPPATKPSSPTTTTPPNNVTTPAQPSPVAPVETPQSATAPTPSAVLIDHPSPPRDRETRPTYRRWWFWTAIGGGAAVIATGVALAVTLSRPPSAPSTTTTDGTFHF